MFVFVYGTLTDPAQVESLLDDYRFVGEATLTGLHRVEGSYPTLAPGGTVQGRLLETSEVAALDAYEGVGRGLYVRVAVPLKSKAHQSNTDHAAVYVGDPEKLDAPAVWPGEGAFEQRVQTFVTESTVAVHVEEDDC